MKNSRNNSKTEFVRGFACGANILDAEAPTAWAKASDMMSDAQRAEMEAGGYYAGCDAGLAWANHNARR